MFSTWICGCLCDFGGWPYSDHVSVIPSGSRRLLETKSSGGLAHCRFEDGSHVDVPGLLHRLLTPGDQVQFLGSAAEVLIERPFGRRSQQLLHANIGHAGRPKVSQNGQAYVRAELPACTEGPRALFLSGDAIRRYFYEFADGPTRSLYQSLNVPDSASSEQLRIAWRMRSLELALSEADAGQMLGVERAFNILAHPDLRNCYDAMRKDDDAPALFPYGGFGAIVAEGRLSKEGDAFFVDQILAYKPKTVVRKVSLLLRQCEFLTDRVVCRDGRRKLEVGLDPNALRGLHWDLTWNHWKQWLATRIAVDATFVTSAKYRLVNDEWTVQTWQVALPSRLCVEMPASLPQDVQMAQQIHALLGQHADLVRHVRQQCEKAPVEHSQVQDWFDEAGASFHLKPHHPTWRPDYEPYYFEQLRKLSQTWFLFRDEYLFVWRNILIAEIPEPGHATYCFTKPANLDEFLAAYAKLTRDDIRRNRGNLSPSLGFIGRVVRGKRKKRWLADVLKQAGEKADYVEAFD